MKNILLVLTILLLLPCGASAQKKMRQTIKRGNQLFEKQDYSNAEIEYRKALELNSKERITLYNLANTLFLTERGEEASKIYNQLLHDVQLLPNEHAADVAHNAGNLALAAKDYATAIELYKTSLRKRPTDDETRYNLALAQKLLEQEQKKDQEGGGENNEQEQSKEEQEQQQKENQEQQQQPEHNKPQQQPSQQQQMSKDNAEKILEAYLQEEKDTQRKVEMMKQQQQKGKKSRPKNW